MWKRWQRSGCTLCPFTLTPAPYKTMWKACRNGPKHVSAGLQAALAGLAGCGVIGFVLIWQQWNRKLCSGTLACLDPAHGSPSLCAGASSRRVLDRTSITIHQQPRELSLRPPLQSFHNLARIMSPSGVFSTDDTLVSSWKSLGHLRTLLAWIQLACTFLSPIPCVPSRGAEHRFHCDEYTVTELVTRIKKQVFAIC